MKTMIKKPKTHEFRKLHGSRLTPGAALSSSRIERRLKSKPLHYNFQRCFRFLGLLKSNGRKLTFAT